MNKVRDLKPAARTQRMLPQPRGTIVVISFNKALSCGNKINKKHNQTSRKMVQKAREKTLYIFNNILKC